ncbi:MAG: HAMP domain-containing sensor histidine kinase [Eubacteriales bacterium]
MVQENTQKVRGLRRRWLVSSLGIVVVILALSFITIMLTLQNFYVGSMTENLRNQASTIASSFYNSTQATYRQSAQERVNNYEHRTTVEIQFLELDGSVLYTSYGLASGTFPNTGDVFASMENRVTTVWMGEDPSSGEHIMAVSAPVIYQGQSVVGAVRLVTSMEAVDAQLAGNGFFLFLTGLALLLLIYFSNLHFVRSIIQSLASITETARQISEGSYGVQIEKQYDDEIGDLTDTINTMSLTIMHAEKTQSEFISSVSHELRTPLTAITGWAETIQSGELQNPVDVSKGMDIIVGETRRLSNMVEELLAFSKMQDGRFTLSVEHIDLKAEVEDAVYTYREFFRKENIELFYFDDEEETIPLMGDPDRLRQVFCNLLDNAGKHGGSGGRIHVNVLSEEGYGMVTIRDFGTGIPVDELPHVKYKFYKGSSKARGSGIGLAVCEEIIQRHGGTLTIENAEEGGCLVTFKIPSDLGVIAP